MPNLKELQRSRLVRDVVRGASGAMGSVAGTGLGGFEGAMPMRRFAGEVFEGIKDARIIQKAHPALYVVNELVYPTSFADGTLQGKPIPSR